MSYTQLVSKSLWSAEDVSDYEPTEPGRLTDADALARYVAAKRDHPDAFVSLEQDREGRWTVEVHSSPEEKDDFLVRFYREMVRRQIISLLGR